MKRLPTNREIAQARLPESYLKARAAMRACARNFTPERYAKAVVALGDAWAVDEVATWPDTTMNFIAWPIESSVNEHNGKLDSDLSLVKR